MNTHGRGTPGDRQPQNIPVTGAGDHHWPHGTGPHPWATDLSTDTGDHHWDTDTRWDDTGRRHGDTTGDRWRHDSSTTDTGEYRWPHEATADTGDWGDTGRRHRQGTGNGDRWTHDPSTTDTGDRWGHDSSTTDNGEHRWPHEATADTAGWGNEGRRHGGAGHDPSTTDNGEQRWGYEAIADTADTRGPGDGGRRRGGAGHNGPAIDDGEGWGRDISTVESGEHRRVLAEGGDGGGDGGRRWVGSVVGRQVAAVRAAAVIGVVATGAAVVLRAVEVSAGSVSVGTTRIGFVATTPFGVAAVARVIGLLWLAASPEGGRLGSLGGVAVLASFVVVGHPQATALSSRTLDGALVAAQAVHVLVAAAWFGGLCCLVLDLRQRRRLGDPHGSAAVISRFSTIAGLAVVTATATGLALARSQVPSVTAAPGTAYGRALLAKLGCVAVVVAIGGYNRQRLVPAVARHRDTTRAWHALRRTLVAEALIIACGVLVATAAMTSGGFTR